MKLILFDHLPSPSYLSLDNSLMTVWSTYWQKHSFDFDEYIALWIDIFITNVYVVREDATLEKEI